MGAHRFDDGKTLSGTLWFLTLGLLGIGWLIDLFLIPGMYRRAERRFTPGVKDDDLIWLLTGGLFLIGFLDDDWTLNEQIETVNDEQCVLAA